MLHRIPRHLPSLQMMLEDLNASPRQVAQALSVSERTVKNWLRLKNEPQSVRISLFWLTRWGWSAIDCDLSNRAQLMFALARSQADYIRRLEKFSIAPKTLKAANDAAFRCSWTKIDNT